MEEKIISFVVKSDKGFFKKPDINDGIYLTYNTIHKPAILGILGAIVGLRGFSKNKKVPEYYEKLKDLKIGVKPLKNGSFIKTVVTYTNTTGFANIGEKKEGANLIINEQTLIDPEYKIYLQLDMENQLHRLLYENIYQQKSEFIPYMGKNDYPLWWNKNEVEEYTRQEFKNSEKYRIETVFLKSERIIDKVVRSMGRFRDYTNDTFYLYERLPIGYDLYLYQYKMGDFIYTNSIINTEQIDDSFLCVENKNGRKVIFLY